MAQCIVLADVITGGSTVGAMLEKNHCTVCSLVNSRGIHDPEISSFDCLVYSTNSRHLKPAQSYQIVFSATRLLRSPEVKIYAKMIDAAMRGNTFTETQALLDALGDPDRVAIVVPAFPALKRICVGGYILVDGKPVQKSLADLDDTPAQTGRIADLFEEKFAYNVKALHIKEYTLGLEHLSNRIRELARDGIRAIIMDCTSQEDINLIADAVIASKIKFLAVDPGPFTATIARKVMRSDAQTHISSNAKIFGIIGGINPFLGTQVEQLKLEYNPLIVTVKDSEFLGDDQSRYMEIARVVEEICSKIDGQTLILAVSETVGNVQNTNTLHEELHPTNRTTLEVIDLISAAYGQITAKVLERNPDIQALYSTGADLTAAACRELKALGMRVMGQVLPLTTYGELLGGSHSGLKCVNTTSSSTDTNTITESIQYLMRKLEI
ncbi:MAG: four-carbon acid sugar kinase family protein [Succinivibrio sp.]|nr:four-carbon acid sugar kinase family protein [Succinivibrio sp.]